MSYDPYAAGSDLPPEHGPAGPTPGGLDRSKSRVRAPAICLIVVGILNLMLVVLQAGRIVLVAMTSPQELVKERDDTLEILEKANALPKGFTDTYKKQQQGESPQDFKNQTILLLVIVCAVGLLIALLPLLGGIRMLSLRSYAVCIAGAIGAAIPCLSCGGFCCFGEVIGIWALVVLINSEVRAAFQ